jgi:hypothetical protein
MVLLVLLLLLLLPLPLLLLMLLLSLHYTSSRLLALPCTASSFEGPAAGTAAGTTPTGAVH